MNILFWNLHRNRITGYVKDCLLENQVDVALFAEHEGLDREALERETGYRLIKGPEEEYAEQAKHCEKRYKIVMFASRNIQAVPHLERGRYSIYTVLNGKETYLFAGIHLQDRFHYPEPWDRLETIQRLIQETEKWESKTACDNIIIIGDFNANPYDDELLLYSAFNAVLFKDVIQQEETRERHGRTYRRFYNPVLNFLSENPRNYGSYYYNDEPNPPVWNCLDQILVSKPLSDRVMELRYLRTIGDINLIKKAAPDKTISDHLPLLVRLEGGNSNECPE